MEEAQRELERFLLRQGYNKDILQAADSYERALNGTGSVLDMPKGKLLFLNVFNSVKDFIQTSCDAEVQKSRKSTYYSVLIEPHMQMWQKDITRKEAYSLFEVRYENPITLMSYFITRELTKLMIREEYNLTVFGRKIANYFMSAYNVFGEASDEALKGAIQLIRIFIDTDYNKYFKTTNYPDGIVVELKEEFDTFKITKEELMETIEENNPAFKPMLVQPIDHHNLLDHSGGYLELKSPVLKNPEFAEVRQYPFTSTNEYGEVFFKQLNALQQTKWTVNKEFFEWMKQAQHPELQKYFNLDIKKMQTKLTEDRRVMNNTIYKTKKLASKARYESTQTTNEEKKLELVRQSLNYNDRVDQLEEEMANITSVVGKARGWQETIKDVNFYSDVEYFYHPVFCDNRGRVYTYNTSLSFQGSQLAKVLTHTYNKQSLSPEGIRELQVLLGGMIDGFDKKSPKVRQNRVQELTEAFEACIKHEDYSVIDLIDEDELLMALNIAYVLYQTKLNPEYETGIVAYIDSTSSAIQIQAIAQKCMKAAGLTNLLPNDTDDLPDAYKAVANTCQDMCQDISTQTDEELVAVMAVFYLENDKSKLTYLGLKIDN